MLPRHSAPSEQPHEAIRRRDRSRFRLAPQTDISENQLSRFTHDKVGLSLSSIDRLCRALGLELRPKDE
jgi:DNA-binding Xre family transcriptional regulator